MSMNETPSGERVRISFFGARNSGKSSLCNAITGQEISVVSDIAGTTTDPVSKAMEILPLGAVLITDTPGFDDDGALGELRVKRTRQILEKTDIAVLVSCHSEETDTEKELIALFRERDIPYLIVKNKCDLNGIPGSIPDNTVYVSAMQRINIDALKERLGRFLPQSGEKRLVGDLILPGQLIVLVIPIDESAPKGRLILPQQQVIRDILESGAYAVTTRDTELEALLGKMRPDLVITDSQVFGRVNAILPCDIPLTSFSIIMARYKGFLDVALQGAHAIDGLCDGDRVLISEGCTHHRQCGDIGAVKLPRLLREYTGRELVTENTSGTSFPDDLSGYKLVIHCGGCMFRMKSAAACGIPFTNYGVAIAHMRGILGHSTEIFFKAGDTV